MLPKYNKTFIGNILNFVNFAATCCQWQHFYDFRIFSYTPQHVAIGNMLPLNPPQNGSFFAKYRDFLAQINVFDFLKLLGTSETNGKPLKTFQNQPNWLHKNLLGYDTLGN